MKIICVMVTSLNGKITNGTDPDIYSWTSPEDQDHFFSLLKFHNLVVMGSKTYEVAKENMDFTRDKLRIVMTRHPEKYVHEARKGKLEFSDEKPQDLVEQLEKQGFGTLLLVGGGEINALFLRENLVDELYLTVEPLIFGHGQPLFAGGIYKLLAKLLSSKKLNDKGTLLLRYLIDK